MSRRKKTPAANSGLPVLKQHVFVLIFSNMAAVVGQTLLKIFFALRQATRVIYKKKCRKKGIYSNMLTTHQGVREVT